MRLPRRRRSRCYVSIATAAQRHRQHCEQKQFPASTARSAARAARDSRPPQGRLRAAHPETRRRRRASSVRRNRWSRGWRSCAFVKLSLKSETRNQKPEKVTSAFWFLVSGFCFSSGHDVETLKVVQDQKPVHVENRRGVEN